MRHSRFASCLLSSEYICACIHVYEPACTRALYANFSFGIGTGRHVEVMHGHAVTATDSQPLIIIPPARGINSEDLG